MRVVTSYHRIQHVETASVAIDSRLSPSILIVEPVHNLDGLFHFLLSRRPSVKDRTIRTGTQDILKSQACQCSRRQKI
jgi:hypothetical protein